MIGKSVRRGGILSVILGYFLDMNNENMYGIPPPKDCRYLQNLGGLGGEAPQEKMTIYKGFSQIFTLKMLTTVMTSSCKYFVQNPEESIEMIYLQYAVSLNMYSN